MVRPITAPTKSRSAPKDISMGNKKSKAYINRVNEDAEDDDNHQYGYKLSIANSKKAGKPKTLSTCDLTTRIANITNTNNYAINTITQLLSQIDRMPESESSEEKDGSVESSKINDRLNIILVDLQNQNESLLRIRNFIVERILGDDTAKQT